MLYQFLYLLDGYIKITDRKEIIVPNDYEQEIQIEIFRIFCRWAGVLIIIFDMAKDTIYETLLLRHNPGMGWQQWALLVAGFVMVGVGVYKKPQSK